jgi:hypothetical protein
MKQWYAIYCAEGNNVIKEEEKREAGKRPYAATQYFEFRWN